VPNGCGPCLARYPEWKPFRASIWRCAPEGVAVASKLGSGGLAGRERDGPRPPWETGELRVFLQPIVELDSGTVLGHEALIRGPEGSPWEAPSGLFAAAARAGAVDRLELACRRAIFSVKQGAARVDGLLFVNVNPEVWAGANGLTENGDAWAVSSEEVLFELSEQQALVENPKVRRFVETLRLHGHRIVLDDFGAGYANLNALLELEPHGLKLGRQLVFDCHLDQRRQTILTLIKEACDQLGVLLIAEGIERPQELTLVRNLGIRYGQGFLLGRPRPAAASPAGPGAPDEVAR